MGIQRLTAANAQAHNILEGLLMDLLEAAVDGRVADALAAHTRLADAFAFHLAAEEAHTLPLLRELGGPLLKLATIVDGDHRIVHRSLDAVGALLGEVADGAGDGRRAVLQRIEVLSKLKTVLEHHGVREQEDIYPPLDQRFPDLPWADALVPPG